VALMSVMRHRGVQPSGLPRTRWRTSAALRAGALAYAMLLALMPVATRAALSEAEAKVALVFNLIAFVDWPRELGQIRLCSVGAEDYAAQLRSLDGTLVAGLTLRERRLEPGESTRGCQVLFIADTRAGRLRRHLEDAAPGTLTIAEGIDAIQAGAIVGIAVEQQRLAFSVNQTAARAGGLAISAKLLRLARTVR
jgi:hypothetical protein